MIEYPQSTTDAARLEPMRGVELVYFVIPEAALWSVVHVLFILDGPVDFELLKHRVQQGWQRFERLRQKPVRKGKAFYWETVSAIDIDEHVKVVPAGVATTQEGLTAFLGSVLTTPLDPARPLWEVHYVPNYETGAAVVLRIHHAYGDGRSLQTIATSIIAPSPEESRQRIDVTQPTIRHQAVADAIRKPSIRKGAPVPGGLFRQLLHRLRVRMRGIRKMCSSFKKDHDTGFDKIPSEQKSVAFSRVLSRSTLRTASAALQCTMNDLVLSGITGAIRNNLVRMGVDPAQTRMTVTIPVDLHSPRSLAAMHTSGILTNHLGTVSIQLPVSIADGAERARVVAKAMTESMESGEPLMQYKSLSSFHKMPQGLLVRMFRGQAHKTSGIISNLPGPKQPFYLAGEKINSWVFWVIAAQLAGSHVGVSVTHYMDDIRIGLTLPVNTGYDVQGLLEAMVVETEALAAQALRATPAGAGSL